MDKSDVKKKTLRPFIVTPCKRAHSVGPLSQKQKISVNRVKSADQRSHMIPPTHKTSKKSVTAEQNPLGVAGANHRTYSNTQDFDIMLPPNMLTKLMKSLAAKKRDFLKMKKHLIAQQNTMLEVFASIRELESRVGIPNNESMGEIRLLTLKKWPAQDLLMIIQDDGQQSLNSEMNSAFGPQVIQQICSQLTVIPEEIVTLGAEIMARRMNIINLFRNRLKAERLTYQANLDWKAKNVEIDNDTDELHLIVASTADNIRAKVNYALNLAKTPWIDRDILIKKLEQSQREALIYQHKLEEIQEKGNHKEVPTSIPPAECPSPNQKMLEDLHKERAAREALKDVVSGAEGMLRVARARISSLERSLKDTRTELEQLRRKHRDLEQLYRNRESSYDARSKKLMEVSKTGEVTIDALSRQRDALESRVKDLREQLEEKEKSYEALESELSGKIEILQAKVAEQEKSRLTTEQKEVELSKRIKELENTVHILQDKSGRLIEAQQRHCYEAVPNKEIEPTDRETDLWKELQVTRAALTQAEEELRQSRADKDDFLNSLSRIAHDGVERLQDKMALELLEKEQNIVKLQNINNEQRKNEKLMEQGMAQYENQLAELRLEVNTLRNYNCYNKDFSNQELQTELLELQMKVATLVRERSALVSAAASRSLMLERHERAADLFAHITRLRRDLSAFVTNRDDPPTIDENSMNEVSRSLSTMCTTAADTWGALRVERARVLHLERAVVMQNLQLEREGRVRTQLERRRAFLERAVVRASPSNCTRRTTTSLLHDILGINRS